jgi:hypothetical protein
MCFGSTNPKVASGADNYDQSHRALSYDLSDELYPNRFVQSNKERKNDFGANTRVAKDKEDQELRTAAPAPGPARKKFFKELKEVSQKKKAFTLASSTYSTL